jgi:hypothetical protein
MTLFSHPHPDDAAAAKNQSGYHYEAARHRDDEYGESASLPVCFGKTLGDDGNAGLT